MQEEVVRAEFGERTPDKQAVSLPIRACGMLDDSEDALVEESFIGWSAIQLAEFGTGQFAL